MPEQLNRRQFIRTTSAIGAALAAGTSGFLRAAETPGEKIIIGVMGTAGRGTSLATGFAAQPGAEVKYVCDVDAKHVESAASAVAGRQKTAPQTVTDFRRILDDGDVDALVIATPNHWHAPATILACTAGKHVYVEKPCSHNPREGELMVEAARKHNRVVQHGTQRRTWPRIIEAIELVRAGRIGRVLFSRGWYSNARGPTGKREPASIPAGLDWSLWQGPAPERPYTSNVVHYKWHWFWHWGNGELGNNGIHSLDICRWGLGVDYPLRVTAGGGRYHFDDDQETPDTHIVTYDFGEKFITWEGRSCDPHGFYGSQFGISFHGDKGILVIDGAGYKLLDPKGKELESVSGSGSDALHHRDFLDSIRTGKRPAADIEEGHKSTLLSHLGNIAWRVGRSVNLDPQTHRIVNDSEAAALWTREYRAGWEPKV